MNDDVVHRQHPLGYALVVRNGQAVYVFVSHGLQSFMDFLARLAAGD